MLSRSYGNDHFPVVLSVGGFSPTALPLRPTIRTSGVDWQGCFAQVLRDVGGIDSHRVEAAVLFDRLVSLSRQALLDNGGKFRKSSKFNSYKRVNHWWTPDCDRYLQVKREAYSVFLRHPSLPNWYYYKDACREKKEISER